MRSRWTPITFPPPASVVERHLDEEESREVFWKATERLKYRTVKLEREQNFQESGNASWEALIAGDYARSIELIEQDRKSLEQQRKPFDDAEVPFYRVRVIQYPLSDYVKWELAHFKLNVEEGETISIVDTARIADIELDTSLKDFVLFDDFLMLSYDYTLDGLPLDTYLVTDTEYLREMSELADELLARAWPFERHPHEPLIPLSEG
ncbi:DUF6879 family protein [Amycolatopsis sp. H20-H5]|uniref:DUF6879 family protein n=1 Tax=Amycolatopsis sp. H20-H5 TaxID=3046309 RepID=UPI002DBE58F3|nr:DUF6879 family protein [Amycolatopsis sp. H20-H5]MEC3974869.1 hypothetical protein [Amycolatopsis sp. H20-H5]